MPPSTLMRAVNDTKADVKALYAVKLPWWVYAGIMTLIVPSVILSTNTGHWGVFRAILGAVLAFFIVILVKWPLRRRAWLRASLAVLAVLHAPLIILIPWSDRWAPGGAGAIASFLDFIIMNFLLNLVAQLFERTPCDQIVV